MSTALTWLQKQRTIWPSLRIAAALIGSALNLGRHGLCPWPERSDLLWTWRAGLARAAFVLPGSSG